MFKQSSILSWTCGSSITECISEDTGKVEIAEILRRAGIALPPELVGFIEELTVLKNPLSHEMDIF
jgi:hypothetical protein